MCGKWDGCWAELVGVNVEILNKNHQHYIPPPQKKTTKNNIVLFNHVGDIWSSSFQGVWKYKNDKLNSAVFFLSTPTTPPPLPRD